ncbi:MAG: hypothetical protein ACOX8B_08940 [Lachnospiraceae bacterium]
MFRLWARTVKKNRLLRDTIIEYPDPDKTRTHKIFDSLTEVCRQFDLPSPIWLDSNISEFKRNSLTRFTQDSFVEEVPFDYLEIRVLEED